MTTKPKRKKLVKACWAVRIGSGDHAFFVPDNNKFQGSYHLVPDLFPTKEHAELTAKECNGPATAVRVKVEEI